MYHGFEQKNPRPAGDGGRKDQDQSAMSAYS